MGTRNLICIFYKGRFMVAQYTQWDGYLEGQGWQILQFLLVPGNIQRLKAGMEYISVVDDETVRQMMEKHSYDTYDRFGQRVCQCGAVTPFSEPSRCFPSTLSRDTGSKVLEIIASARSDSYIPFVLNLEFATDSLFCEYCYCIDLDADTFELFGGHVKKKPVIKSESDDEQQQQQQHTGELRFDGLDPNAECVPHFLKSFSFDDLPKDLDDMLAKVTVDNPAMVEYEKNDDDNDNDDQEDDKEESENGERETDSDYEIVPAGTVV